MSDPPLPDIEDGQLDDAGLNALITDITSLASSIEVRCKGAGEHSAPASLSEAVSSLRAGVIAAVQVSYVHRGQRWIDTVMRAPQGWRIVRFAPDF